MYKPQHIQVSRMGQCCFSLTSLTPVRGNAGIEALLELTSSNRFQNDLGTFPHESKRAAPFQGEVLIRLAQYFHWEFNKDSIAAITAGPHSPRSTLKLFICIQTLAINVVGLVTTLWAHL